MDGARPRISVAGKGLIATVCARCPVWCQSRPPCGLAFTFELRLTHTSAPRHMIHVAMRAGMARAEAASASVRDSIKSLLTTCDPTEISTSLM